MYQKSDGFSGKKGSHSNAPPFGDKRKGSQSVDPRTQGKVVPYNGTSKSKKQGNEAVKVCVRVRPLLPHERMKDEIVYYPDCPVPNL